MSRNIFIKQKSNATLKIKDLASERRYDKSETFYIYGVLQKSSIPKYYI